MNLEKYRKHKNFIEKYKIASNASTGSAFDSNANVENKNITTLTGEIPKKEFIGINRLYMFEKLCELYGEDCANEYIHELETHRIYKHDETSIYPYCVSITMYPFLATGLNSIGGGCTAPHNLDSFCGSFINLCFAIAAQFAGALATPEFLPYMDYFIRKEYGDDYYLHSDEVVEMSLRKRTIDKVICDKFSQVTYSLNQPAAARSFQSIFWNIAYFDKPYFEGMFENFMFPDNTPMKWESISWLQKRYMKWFNAERLKSPLTFPVETLNLLNDGNDIVDKEYKEFASEMWSEGHSFFCYTSDSVDSLASCCYSEDTNVIIKSKNGIRILSFKELCNNIEYLGDFKILNNGKWSSGKLVKLPARKMFKVTTRLGKTMVLTDNHRNNCLSGMKLTKDLTIDDYLLISHKIPFDVDSETNVMNDNICDATYKDAKIFVETHTIPYEYLNCPFSSRQYFVEHIFVNSWNKHLTKDEFVFIEAMCTSVGYMTSSVVERDKYNIFLVVDLFDKNELYPDKINSIEETLYSSDYVYCFEMEDKNDDKFTLSNGIHNFNCRLRNELQDNTFSYTLGAGGVSTGSKGVITININRLVQDCSRLELDISEEVSKQVERVHKYLIAYNEIIKDYFKANLLPVYNAGFIDLKKQFLTIGINGLVEGAEFLGIKISPNDDYFKYAEMVLKPIYESNKKAKTNEIMFNTEYVPAENLGVKNATWDKEDGYWVPRDCYNSYFYLVEDESTNVIDKLILHGKSLTKYLDGGSACHINLDEHLSKENYMQLLESAVKTGCSYFTYNIPNTVCNDCGYISKNRLDKCPKCGSENVDYLTRVIGYLKRVSKFSEARQKEAEKRYYAPSKM